MELDLSCVDPERLYCNAIVLESGVAERFDPKSVIVWDIETGPLGADDLAEAMVPYPDMQPFDEAGVKTGNLKDEKKVAEKIVAAREKHVEDYRRARAKYEREFVEKAALDPMRGQVIAIGYGDHAGQRVIHAAADEADLLTELWSIYMSVARGGGKLVGWNIHKFDLPFCRLRTFRHGLPVPDGILKNSRYWNECLVDLMGEWCCGQGYMGLDAVAKFLRVGAKNGDGAEFARLWSEDREQAIEYLANDIDMTVAVAKRMGH